MKILNIIISSLILLMFTGSAGAETLKAIVIDGNTLFNDTINPADRPFEKFYTKEELTVAKTNAERGSKLFLLTRDGTLYSPAPKKGEKSTIFLNQNMNAPRINRIQGFKGTITKINGAKNKSIVVKGAEIFITDKTKIKLENASLGTFADLKERQEIDAKTTSESQKLFATDIEIKGLAPEGKNEEKAEKIFTWLTLVHVVGHEVEVTGDIYPGYSGVKGIYIKTIECDEVK